MTIPHACFAAAGCPQPLRRTTAGPTGIDGCPGGWIAASCDNIWIDRSLADLLATANPNIVALDMPIGLAEDAPRGCDIAARRLLGRPRGASVFAPPVRAALAATSHAQACDRNALACGKRVSIQAFHLLTKIREVDALLRASAHWRSRVFETHPEVSFAAMNGHTAFIQPKRGAAGRAKRQSLVAAYFGKQAFGNARDAIAKRMAADDDIADAFACLFTAERIARGAQVSLPVRPEIDRYGLPMRIVY